MPEIRYQAVTEAPTEAIVALYQAGGWWDETPAAREAIPAMIRGSFRFLVAVEGERIVGMGRAISDGASDAYIQDVVVLPELRGRGIGRELVRRLTEHCVAARLQWIGLIAEPGTSDFYRELGYAPLERFEPMRHRGGSP